MKSAHAFRWFVIALLLVTSGDAALAQAPSARSSAQQPTSARRIAARDGDVVVVDNDARVRIVRRRDANVHAIFNAAQAWVVLLVDYIDPTLKVSDDRVDFTYSFNSVSGDWPFGERWEGTATVEDYSVAGEGMTGGLGLSTPGGLVQFLAPLSHDLFRDQAAVAVLSFQGSGRGGGGGQSFAEAEQLQIANAIRNAESRGRLPAGTNSNFQTSVSMGVSGPLPGGIIVDASPGQAPVRVGGNIASPQKLVDMPPVYPPTARGAGITGVVILEVTIGTDGSVTNPRVLRSIPQLDAAAVEAVRQWRYEPTLLNGTPVPVIMVVTVRFP
jgi:TonB family protein